MKILDTFNFNIPNDLGFIYIENEGIREYSIIYIILLIGLVDLFNKFLSSFDRDGILINML